MKTKGTCDNKTFHRMRGESCSRAALNECEDGRLTTFSGRLFHKWQADTKNDVWNEVVLANGTQTEWGWWIRELKWTGGEKYADGGIMDSFMIMRLHSKAFCLEWRERRVGQFKVEVRVAGESDQRFVHSLAAKLWTDSNFSTRVVEAGSQTLLQ